MNRITSENVIGKLISIVKSKDMIHNCTEKTFQDFFLQNFNFVLYDGCGFYNLYLRNKVGSLFKTSPSACEKSYDLSTAMHDHGFRYNRVKEQEQLFDFLSLHIKDVKNEDIENKVLPNLIICILCNKIRNNINLDVQKFFKKYCPDALDHLPSSPSSEQKVLSKDTWRCTKCKLPAEGCCCRKDIENIPTVSSYLDIPKRTTFTFVEEKKKPENMLAIFDEIANMSSLTRQMFAANFQLPLSSCESGDQLLKAYRNTIQQMSNEMVKKEIREFAEMKNLNILRRLCE